MTTLVEPQRFTKVLYIVAYIYTHTIVSCSTLYDDVNLEQHYFVSNREKTILQPS